MYAALIGQLTRNFQYIDAWLDKAEAFATEKGLDVNQLLEARLAPDMGAFIYQVQSASDYVKGAAALLSGSQRPAFADVERTAPEVHERIRKTVEFVHSIPETAYEGAGDRRVEAWGHPMRGDAYFRQIALPNAFFHITMAYGILRNQGVPVGKLDYIGPYDTLD